MDVISRDPSGQTLGYGLPPNLSEDGRFAYLDALITLPYSAPDPFSPPVGRGDDISNTGRFILTHGHEVYDRTTNTLEPGAAGAYQVGDSGRYLLVNSVENLDIPVGTDGGSHDFIYDRTTRTYRGISRSRAGATNTGNDTQVIVEMDENEESVFFSNFAGGTLLPGETSTLFIYDIATDSLSVPPPLRGKAASATFLDASSNGRFILFSWNPQAGALRPSEPRDDAQPRSFTYLYDRDQNVLSFIESPVNAVSGAINDITISNDGNIISYRQIFGINNTALWVAARQPGTDVWATKRLLDIPEASDFAGHIRMSDDGGTFLFTTLRWNQLVPGYRAIGSQPTQESNVVAITGFRAGGASTVPTFATYAATAFAAYPPALRAPLADADGNGISNWFEFLSGRSTTGPSRPLIALGNITGVPTITFRQLIGAPATFVPEYSPDLGATVAWVSIADQEIDRVETIPGVWEITVSIPPGAPLDRGFYRLRAPVP